MRFKISRKKKFLVLLGILVVLACYGNYLIYWDYPIEGRVLDKETGEPMAGAVVAARYTIDWMTPGGSVHTNLTCQEAVTDENGYFRIPVMITMHPIAFFAFLEDYPDILIFALGYEKILTWNPPEDLEQDSEGKYIVRIRRIRDKEELKRNLQRCRPVDFSSKGCPKLSDLRKKEYYNVGINMYKMYK